MLGQVLSYHPTRGRYAVEVFNPKQERVLLRPESLSPPPNVEEMD